MSVSRDYPSHHSARGFIACCRLGKLGIKSRYGKASEYPALRLPDALGAATPVAVNPTVPNRAAQYQHAIRDDRKLSSNAKLVAYSLAARFPDIRPSLATLAADASLAKSTTCIALTELEQHGWIRRARTSAPQGDADNTRYQLVVPNAIPSVVPVGVVRHTDNGSTSQGQRVVRHTDSKSQGQGSRSIKSQRRQLHLTKNCRQRKR